MSSRKYSKEIIQEAVSASVSIAGVLRHLGVKAAGGSHSHISRIISKYEIDISHFTGRGHYLGKPTHNKKHFNEILVLLPMGSNKAKSPQLRRALVESGVLEKCLLCGITDTWNGAFIRLEVDHIDGNWLNNVRDNLRFLCPNCHSQQSTTNRPHKFRNVTND